MSDKRLKDSIKQHEARKRAEAMEKLKEIKTVTPAGEEDKISFDQWWMMVNKSSQLKPWMKEVIFADFKGRSLTKEETAAKYDWALQQFGYKAN